MDYELEFDAEGDYLHAIVTGKNSRGAVAGYLQDVLEECKKQACEKVLVEERLDGPRLSIVDVFHLASEGSAGALGVIRALAYVDMNATGDAMQFAETVAANRSLPVRVFEKLEDARDWISRQ